jgi:Domain of unknown function (DUF3854)
MTQITESPSTLERMVAEIEALSLKDQFWLMERLMQGIRSQTLSVSEAEDDRFWHRVESYPDTSIVFTEGGKKALSLLDQGNVVISSIELDESDEDPLEYVDGVLIIKSQGQVLSVDLVNEMREDRMQDVGGW